MTNHRLALDDGSLVDVLDRLLDVGACVDGTVLLTLAGVDLVRLDLRLLLASIETLQVDTGPRDQPAEREPTAPVPAVRRPTGTMREDTGISTSRREHGSSAARAARAARTSDAPRVHTASDLSADEPDGKDRQAGVAGLVVVVVDIVRQLLERQALRRMDAGSLTAQEVERLGQSLMALERQTAELTDFLGEHRRHQNPLGDGLNPQWLGQNRLAPPPRSLGPEGRSHR